MIVLNKNPNFPAVIPAVRDLGEGFAWYPHRPVDFAVAWMRKPPEKIPLVIGETGFFFDACHFDASGLFQASSLRGNRFLQSVESFKPPYYFADKMLRGIHQPSKFRQPDDYPNWDGVVLATQNPTDKSITDVGPPILWWMFYQNACAYYGKNLFVKIHPWVKGEDLTKMETIARASGCTYGKVSPKVVKKCKFVITYNSTFAVDCFLYGARVAYFAPGYFSECGAVSYTNWTLPDQVPDKSFSGYKLYEWLAWKYCVWTKNDTAFWDRFFKWCQIYYPHQEIPTDMSYAAHIDRVSYG